MEGRSRTYTLRFNKEHYDTFAAIRDGRKTVETRAATMKYKAIREGDVLVMSCAGEQFEKTVRKVVRVKSIEELPKQYALNEIIPGVSDLDAAKDIYYSFPGYREKIAEFGLLCFELE